MEDEMIPVINYEERFKVYRIEPLDLKASREAGNKDAKEYLLCAEEYDREVNAWTEEEVTSFDNLYDAMKWIINFVDNEDKMEL
jgi:hypothetical protein